VARKGWKEIKEMPSSETVFKWKTGDKKRWKERVTRDGPENEKVRGGRRVEWSLGMVTCSQVDQVLKTNNIHRWVGGIRGSEPTLNQTGGSKKIVTDTCVLVTLKN